jgi:hypothetical protein
MRSELSGISMTKPRLRPSAWVAEGPGQRAEFHSGFFSRKHNKFLDNDFADKALHAFLIRVRAVGDLAFGLRNVSAL